MKPSKTGLVSAGGVSKLFIARMPVLLRNIGPVKATTFRVARRISNLLRAGRPVEDYAGLNGCDLVWIAVPEAALDRIADPDHGSRGAAPERARGAVCRRDDRFHAAGD